MINWSNKKLIHKFFRIFLIILITNICIQSFRFTENSYNKYYHQGEEYISEYKDTAQYELFSNYDSCINTENIPKTYKNYLNTKHRDNAFYYIYDYKNINYSNPNWEEKARLEFIKSLEKHHKDTTNNMKPQLYNYKNYKLFYNESGELVFIEYEKDMHNYYRYDINGKLAEAEWYNCNEVNIVFSPNEELKYYFYKGSAFPFWQYHISYSKYIIKVVKEILLSSIIIFLLYLLHLIVRKNKFPTLINKNYFQEYENKNKHKKFYIIKKCIQNIKSHIWSHITMLLGLFCGFLLLYFWGEQGDKSLYLLVCITISSYLFFISLFCILLETIFFYKFKIRWKFIYENKFYNITWILGQIFYLIFLLTIIIPLFIFHQEVY